jgi:hypothetical protein
MAGFVPAIHAVMAAAYCLETLQIFARAAELWHAIEALNRVDGRDKPGHDSH